MDADILRLILFLAGVGLILGIYFWDRHKQVNARVHAIRKAQLEDPASDLAPDEARSERIDPKWSRVSDTDDAPEPPLVHPPIDDVLASDDLEAELQRLDSVAHASVIDDSPVEVHQESFSFTADDPDDELDPLVREGLPGLILQINVVAAKGNTFTGEQILRVAQDVELEHGDMNIFHRYAADDPKSRVVFSMASMMEPGIFPLDQMSEFSTPGLVLFGQLPGPKDGLAAFSDMLFTAERLAALLDGELQDETHSVLSKQTIEHIRGRILEHRRQVQLALSKR
ncbi:cell division protein ZipA [Sedimenticola sp.]|uniref:cell division protein ZipA n=1 Tax=Sedimenticola sp. TaxID=1940285 RepID=UPI003D0AE987